MGSEKLLYDTIPWILSKLLFQIMSKIGLVFLIKQTVFIFKNVLQQRSENQDQEVETIFLFSFL